MVMLLVKIKGEGVGLGKNMMNEVLNMLILIWSEDIKMGNIR